MSSMVFPSDQSLIDGLGFGELRSVVGTPLSGLLSNTNSNNNDSNNVNDNTDGGDDDIMTMMIII